MNIIKYVIPFVFAAVSTTINPATTSVAISSIPNDPFDRITLEYSETGNVSTTTIKTYLEAILEPSEGSLIEVARCESRLRHWDSKGNVLIGEITPDIGLFQINPVHLDEAKKLGLDIYNLRDNISFARHLFAQQRLIPWYSSQGCWKAHLST